MWSENELKFFPVKRQQRLAFRNLAVPRLHGWVADLGAGSGPYHREIFPCTIVALDRVVSPVIQVIGSVTALPFKAAFFDGVIMTETLEHVHQPQLALAEAVRILRPHGWLYLATPQMWPLHYEPHDYFRFTRYGLTYLLEEAGLQEVTLQPLGGLSTLLFTRLGEKFIKLLVNLLGWLPRPRRWAVAGVLGLPVQYLLYLLSRWLDRLTPKDVLGWAVVARKGPGSP
jgi:SAM-dependent methyltransferase